MASPKPTATTAPHGLHGNMTFMPHLPVMQWDFRDQLQATSRQVANDETPETHLVRLRRELASACAK